MQACPYDALYIDPATQTAAKCNYCAHRLEVGLEPACVIVCPERAIIAGDLDDPRSGIAKLVATEQVQVRKPEQGTRPKVFYLGGDAAALTPSLQAPAATYMWAQRPADEVSLVKMLGSLGASSAHGDGALVAGVGRRHPARLWRRRGGVARRRARRGRRRITRPGAAGRASRRGRGRLQRFSLRPGRGPRLLAEPARPAAAARLRRRCGH